MQSPCYITLKQARKTLSEMGGELNERQMKCASETDVHGRRKFPFFIDPIDKKLKIEKGLLIEIYRQVQSDAQENARTKLSKKAISENDPCGAGHE